MTSNPVAYLPTSRHPKFTEIRVANSFAVKDSLRARGYQFSGRDKVWSANVPNDQLAEEIAHLVADGVAINAVLVAYHLGQVGEAEMRKAVEADRKSAMRQG